MTVQEIVLLIRRWWWTVALCVALGAASAYILSDRMTPVYEADATMLVEHQLDGRTVNFESIQAAERRTQTFSRLVTTRSVLEPVIEDLDLDMTTNELRQAVSSSQIANTQLLRIHVEDISPDRAAEIANAIANQFAVYVRETQRPVDDVAEGELSDSMEALTDRMTQTEQRIAALQALGPNINPDEQLELDRLQTLLEEYQFGMDTLEDAQRSLGITQAWLGSRAQVAELATPPAAASSPRTILNTALGAVLGLVIGSALMVFLGYIDDKVRTPEDVGAVSDSALVTAIPIQRFPQHIEGLHSGRSVTGEVFQGLRTNIDFARSDGSVRSILVTSSREEEGKSTVAVNFAAAMAAAGKRVILVDADLRRPAVHRQFAGIFNHKGLSNVLLSDGDIDSTLQATSIDKLQILTSGTLPLNPAVLLSSPRMQSLIDELEEKADVVVYDSPPVPLADTLTLAGMISGAIYVIRSGLLHRKEVQSGLESLARSGTHLLGIVLNAAPSSAQSTHRLQQTYYGAVVYEPTQTMPESPSKPRWFDRLIS